MGLLKDVILDTSFDCLKMLPYLFVAFILIEALEHYSGEWTGKLLAKVGKAGPIVGALAGCIPQCGFSVMAANLYAGGILSVGTLLAVFIATSDEAILIMLGNPEAIGEVGALLAVKVIIAIAAGYIVDIFFKNKISLPGESGNPGCQSIRKKVPVAGSVGCQSIRKKVPVAPSVGERCGCHEKQAGIWKPALNHTVKIFIYLFVFTGILNFCVEIFGIEQLSAFLLGDTVFQPVIAAVIGLIPNCAASVILTQLYLSGAISFASVIAGLCTGAGIGLVVLCRVNRDKRENARIIGTLYVIAVLAGMILEILIRLNI